jgi:ParB-like chromosome segregation protein Spo0J
MSKSKLKFHPAAEVLPLDMTHVESLAESIKTTGQKFPIQVTHENHPLGQVVVCGRHRALACEKLGIPPKKEVLPEGISEEEIYNLSAVENSQRRTISAGQRAAAAAEAIYALYLREGVSNAKGSGEKRTAVCGSFRAGEKFTEYCITLRQNATDLFDKVKSGGENVEKAYKEYKERVKAEEKHKKLVDEIRSKGYAERLEEGDKSADEILAEIVREAQEEKERAEAEIKEAEIMKEYAESFMGTFQHPEKIQKGLAVGVIDKPFIQKLKTQLKLIENNL